MGGYVGEYFIICSDIGNFDYLSQPLVLNGDNLNYVRDDNNFFVWQAYIPDKYEEAWRRPH